LRGLSLAKLPWLEHPMLLLSNPLFPKQMPVQAKQQA
jgi:hypothetical protein